MTVGERLRTAGCGGSVTPSSGVISVVNSPDPFREGSLSSGQTKAPASADLPLITQAFHHNGLLLTRAALSPGACRWNPLGTHFSTLEQQQRQGGK